MPLTIDLHTHMKVAKRTPMQAGEPARFARILQRRGIHALAIAEHAHAPDLWQMFDALRAQFIYEHGRFIVGPSLFYTGVEITLAERADAVVLGDLEDIRALDNAFDFPLSAGYHPEGAELADVTARLGSLAVIAAHPLREDKPIGALGGDTVARLFDAVEINARWSDPDTVARVERIARGLGVGLTGGSDAHVWLQTGAAWTHVDAASDRADDVLEAIRLGRCRAALRPDAEHICRLGSELKASLKASLPRLDALPPTRLEPVIVRRHTHALLGV
ncbi:MAG: PHP-associated domain-containing protein [Phycisphaerales bacterium]